MHGSGEMDCQSAISINPIMEKKTPEMVMMQLFSWSLCISSLWRKHKAGVNDAKMWEDGGSLNKTSLLETRVTYTMKAPPTSANNNSTKK